MKVIIACCRDWTASLRRVDEVVEQSGFEITELVYGVCEGIDESGKLWADDNMIPVKPFPADWDQHGPAAGPIRNRVMAEYADALLAFWDGKSRGTLSMIKEMRRVGKPYRVVPLGGVTLTDTVNPTWVLPKI